MIRVKIKGTTIFGYVQEDYQEVKLPKIAFFDEEIQEWKRVHKKLIKPAYPRERSPA